MKHHVVVVYFQAARTVVKANSSLKLEATKREHFEAEAGNYWNKFYTVHANRLFKDRNWLFTEFPELLSADQEAEEGEKKAFNMFEIGCGVGNTCLLYTSPSPRDRQKSRMPSSA